MHRDPEPGVWSTLDEIRQTIKTFLEGQTQVAMSSSSSGKGPSPAGAGGSTQNRLTTILRDGLIKVISTAGAILDRALPPQRREQYKNWLIKFATERPYLASFLLSQIALSGLPLVLFCCMTVSVFIFSILAGVLLGVI
ncbi:hypothetical protein LTR40_014669, partial [Exophiala xenobiotica]